MRRQSWMYRWLVMAGLVLGLALPAQATLVDRGSFNDGQGGSMNLFYDDDRNITWLGNANFGADSSFDNGSNTTDGRMTWQNAGNWASSLTVGGFTDWRLPTALNQNGTGPCSGFNCPNSEMGHVFSSELGNVGFTSGCTMGTNCGLVNTGPFSNLQAGDYWSGTGFAPNASVAWRFNFDYGLQSTSNKGFNLFAWAVHSGDVSAPAAVPAPSAMQLMGSGLIGLLAWRRFGRG